MAEASAATLSEMNPFVKVSGCPKPAEEGLAAFLAAQGVQVLVLSSPSAAAARSLNSLCRAAGVKFFWAHVWSSAGCFFADLGESHCAASALKREVKEGEEPPPPPPPTLLHYVPLEVALQAPPEQVKSYAHPAYWLMRSAAAEDAAALAAIPAAAAALTPPRLAVYGEPELAPICAVVGGVLANDVLKCISGVGEPTHNIFVFDLETAVGTIDRVGC